MRKIYIVMLPDVLCSWGYTAGAPGLYDAYRSPMDNAYHYYALQNPLDAGIGTCKSVLEILIH